MRRLLRLVTLLALVQPGLVLAGSWAAQAATGTASRPGVARQAWFRETAFEQASPPVAAGSAPASEPSGVPKGDLAVAYTGDPNGASSKMSVVLFDLAGVGRGATIDDLTVSLTLDTSGSAASADAAGAPIVACLPTRSWSPADGGDYADAPTVDCASKVAPTVNGNTFTFKLASLAQSWVDDQNLGVAFVNDPANTHSPFQAVFTGGRTVRAAMTWTPAPATPTTTTGQPGARPAGMAATSVPGASPVAYGAPGNLPPATTVAPPTGPAPQVAGTSPGTSLPMTTVARVKPSSALPTAPFWVAVLAVAVLVVGASLVLGDPVVPVASATHTRLDRVLRARTVATTSLTTHRVAPLLAPRGA